MGALLRFCIVGTLGFLVDGATTLALVKMAGLSPMVARVLAFLLAASVTWQLNRRFTFRSDAARSSWLPYVALTSVGALVNIGVYRLWLGLNGVAPAQLVVGIALGSVAALVFNFGVSRRLFGARLTATNQ